MWSCAQQPIGMTSGWMGQCLVRQRHLLAPVTACPQSTHMSQHDTNAVMGWDQSWYRSHPKLQRLWRLGRQTARLDGLGRAPWWLL